MWHVTVWVGRALEWHSRGQRFDPAYLHQKSSKILGFQKLFFLSEYLNVRIYFPLLRGAEKIEVKSGPFIDLQKYRINHKETTG